MIIACGCFFNIYTRFPCINLFVIIENFTNSARKIISFLFVILHFSGMKKFEYKGKQWHEDCFCCMVCKEPIRNKSFIPRENEVVCVPCYEVQFAQKCTKCNGVSKILYYLIKLNKK